MEEPNASLIPASVLNPECREVVSLSRLGLPAGVGEQRTDKLDPMVGPARRQQARIDVSGIHEMRGGQQVPAGQRLMDEGCYLHVRHRCRRRQDVDDDMGFARVAGLGKMRLIADPGDVALLAKARVGVVGRVAVQAGGR